jgi:tRNA A-37 threonylcarbamoyl transferase component Bud32
MDQLQPGQTLGAYRIINQVGQGGMATVYKAYQPSMDRNVAIKVLPSQLAQTKEFVKRFEQEARIIAKLEHAHILPVFDYGESEGVAYFVMRYLDAGSLKEKMEAGPLPLKEIDRIFTQLADALGYAHSQGVIHRDLKPSNALIDAQGNLFLTDFGIAKILASASPRLTQTDAIMGTPAYISPEQAQATKVDQRSDIYSLGIILYELITGRVPYTADTPLAVILKHVSDPLPLPSSVKPDIPEAIEHVILKALAKNPDDRYATTAEFVSAWKHALEIKETVIARHIEPTVRASVTDAPLPAHQTQATLAPVSKASPKSGKFPRWAIGCIAGACILFAVMGIIVLRGISRANSGGAPTDEATLAIAGEATTQEFATEIGDEIMPGEPEAGAGLIEAPGSKDIYTFSAEPGEIIYVHVIELPETSDLIDFYLTDDLGNDLFYSCLQCGDPGIVQLDRGGEYTLTVGNDDPDGAGYGAYRIKLWEVPPPDEFSIEFDMVIARDQPAQGLGYIENPGNSDAYYFTAESGQLVYVQVIEPPQTPDLINWALFDSAGNAVFETCLQCGDPGLITLERGGDYRLYVGNQSGAATGTYSFKIWSVPPFDSFDINIGDTISNGFPRDGAGFITIPGEHDIYIFTATAGQTITLKITDVPTTSELINWRLEDENGQVLFESCLQCGDPQPITLPSDGEYRIIVGSDTSPGTGAYGFTITSP